MNARSSALSPLFLDSLLGRIFALYYAPSGPARGALLYIPPLGEEMNRCRALVAAQAQALAAQGYAVMVLDLYGTGDGGGELADATWEAWRADVDTAADWLREQSGTAVTLWGLRLGALLAAEMASREPARYERLLLWQPVSDGKTFLTQTLRLRVAFLMDRGLPPETTDQMRAQMQAGASAVISGYVIPGALGHAMDQLRIADFKLSHAHIDWLENVSEPGKPLTMGSQKVIDGLRAQGAAITAHPFCAPPIWQLHERDEAPDLLAKTSALFEQTK
jgi:exosortase A-associated hydrolase 2